jgi:apolipoprotein D and lipocalin family protein
MSGRIVAPPHWNARSTRNPGSLRKARSQHIARALVLAALCVLSVCGCVHSSMKPITPVPEVVLPRFMGDWYVIASIPSFVERNAYDAVESYAMRPDGRIQTTFRYRNNSFDAPLKTMRPVGTVKPGTGNAVWGMQFIWPIKAQYIVAYLDPGYTETIIARDARDYAWIMARTPQISDEAYAADVARLEQMGYDTSKLRRVPQQPR